MITTPEVCPIAQRLLLWAPLCTAQAISQLPIRKTQTLVFQHDPSLVEKPGFLLLSSPSVAFFRSFARAQRHCNKSSGEKSQCGFVIYQNPHFFCISPASQETGWKETKLNIILSFSLVILSPNGFLDPFQLKTPLGIVAAH